MKLKNLIIVLLVIVTVGFKWDDDPKRFLKPTDDDILKFTNVGNIGLTVTNFGVFGHGFTRRSYGQPSCEYPKGSGIEHLFAAGLWIGGTVDGQARVTTGAVDASTISGKGGGGFEFTNDSGSTVQTRSSLVNSPIYSPSAISHQDFLADYTDTNTATSNGIIIPYHNPLGITVHQETYAWNFSFADYFVILNFTIKNVKVDSIKDLHVGIWADAVVRNIKVTQETGTSFYIHGGNGYVDSLRLAYQFDYDGDPGATDSYFGIKFLGSKPKVDSTYFQSWQFRNTSDPIYFTPQDDQQRLERMSVGLSRDKINPLREKPSNRMTLLSTGNYGSLKKGDSLNVTFAILCAKKWGSEEAKFDKPEQRKNLVNNALWAQRAYDNNYILPSPPKPPIVKMVPEDRKVTLYWDKSSESSIDPISNKKDFEGYKIYRTNAGDDLDISKDLKSNFILAATFDSLNNQISYNTGFQQIESKTPYVFPNDTNKYYYKFTFDNLLNGWQYAFSVTAFDKGDPENNVDILEVSPLVNAKQLFPGTKINVNDEAEVGVYPNPYYANAIWDGGMERQRKIYFYNLPQECEIIIYTLAGDIVTKLHHSNSKVGNDAGWFQTYARDTGNQIFTGGEHAWDLITERDQAIATGLYLFTVKDLNTSKIKKGKFLIIK